jgi:hypothetical protein
MSNTSISAAKPLSTLSEHEARLAPAGARIVAAELTRLVVVWRINPQQWRDMSVHYLEALAELPADVLHSAVSQLVRTAKSGDYFPRPGDILELCRDDMANRHALLEHAKADAEAWPQWLADTWGPLPDGPRNRAAALRAAERR